MGIEGGPKFNPEEQDPPTPKTETEKVKNIKPETKKAGGIIRNFLDTRSQRKKQEKVRFQEGQWGDYDSEFWHFAGFFAECLPEEYKHKGWEEGLKSYIENTLSREETTDQREKSKLTAVEFGGPGSKFFRGFSNGFFEKTIGVCLVDIRGENLKNEDSSLNHYVVAGNILGADTNETLNEVKTMLDTTKVDLIVSRMQGALKGMDMNLLDDAVRQWYALLNENGVMFIQYNWASSSDKREDNVAAKCIEMIKGKYPQLDVQLGRGVMRLHKKLDDPEQLPENAHFFVQNPDQNI
ncbi:MAG: hypothetical protein A3H70_01635 [Candidatus Komeilibacteria bacterium RIFCSPLOWO2_02_FULL_48_11]|uniref:Uncharacterized protein n=1 Tax=Candidatus Komeilibacteria bacterium RIFCSPLOWO2_02_FULL_48_11 TaxID=1798553 RepID=A0A1G2BRQ4_9BACT|nr:MAG: hypothetical protein A3H70_01635 [Candidatus Komeilibacteria bacterium RIFCSPLOWO2_02_FULL_48_11]